MDNLMMVGIGLLSVFIAQILDLSYVGLAGWIYFLIPVGKTLVGTIGGRLRRQYKTVAQDGFKGGETRLK